MVGESMNEFKTSRESSFGAAATGAHILSQKVSRALELRTDTPAMTSALEALASLSSSSSSSAHNNNNNNNNSCNPQQARTAPMMVDSKLVRSIMEKDALNQALLYQSQLESLLRSVADMKSSIASASAIVASVQSAIEMDVCHVSGAGKSSYEQVLDPSRDMDLASVAVDPQMAPTTNEDSSAVPESGEDEEALSPTATDNSAMNKHVSVNSTVDATSTAFERKEKSLQAEQALAMKLHDAFVARDACRKRYESLNRFLEKFQMSEQENELLQYFNFGQQQTNLHASPPNKDSKHPQKFGASFFDPDSPEGFQFLDKLDKVRTIREELSKTLLEEDYGGAAVIHQHVTEQLGATSALRMMEKLAQKQEMAYERLYLFLQQHLNLNNNASTEYQHRQVPTSSVQQRQQPIILDRVSLEQQQASPDDDVMEERLSHPFTKRALASLSHVPTFYSHCLELIAGSRRAEVTRRFLLALTSGYDNLAPIEMRAHDPVSYVGDMLAFAFRTFSVESDLARGLFIISREPQGISLLSEEEGKSSGDYVHNEFFISSTSVEYLSSITKSPYAMVAHSMSGLARPLKSRILQVVSSLSRRPEDEEAYDLGGNISADKDGALNELLPEEGMEAIPTSARNRLAALYSLCGLLLFYNHQMGKTLERLVTCSNQIDKNNSGELESPGRPVAAPEGDDRFDLLRSGNPLIQTLIECLQEANESFVASLKVYSAMLKSYSSMAEESEADLAKGVVALITETRNSSPGFEPYILSTHPDSASALSLELLCNTVINAAISSCDKLEDAVTLKEAIGVAIKAGLSEDCAEKWQAQIGSKEQELVEDLVGKATGKMLYDCGLGAVAQAIWNREMSEDTTPIATYPGLGQHDIQAGMTAFYSSLYSPPFPPFDSIKDSSLKNSSRAMTAANVVDTYKQIYDFVQEESAGYDDLSFISHSPEQVRALLS